MNLIKLFKVIKDRLGLTKHQCEVCGVEDYFVSKRTRAIGHGQKGTMTSQKAMCDKCWGVLSKII